MNISPLFEFLSKVENSYEELCQPVLKEFGIPKTSFDILMFLKNNPEHYTAKEISLHNNLKSSVVSLHVDRLVNSGYLKREAVAGDRRKIRLSCTEKADDITDKGIDVQNRFIENLTNGISSEQYSLYENFFKNIIENIDSISLKNTAT